MDIVQNKRPRYFLALMISALIILSIFSSYIVSSREVDNKVNIILQKRGNDLENSITSRGTVIEDYDDFVLLKTTDEGRLALKRDGYSVESLDNRYHVGLKSYSFDSRNGPPDISTDLKIDGYENGETGQYIVQFIGPIKSEWKEEMRDRGVSFHEFRHRFNYIVSMDPGVRKEVEELEFINWIGIYQPAYRLDKDLLESEGPVPLEVEFIGGSKNSKSIPEKRISALSDEVSEFLPGKMKIEASSEDIERIARLNSVLSVRRSTEQYRFLNADATWISQTNEEDYRKVTEKGVTGDNELITVMDSQLYIEDNYHGDGVHEMWEDPDGNDIGDDHRKVQAWYVPGDSSAKLDYGVYHGTHVTGTVLGDSPGYGGYDNNDGHAIGARLIFQDIDNEAYGLNLPSDMYNMGWGDAYDRGSRVHTNSWGGGNGYGGYGLEGDQFLWDHKDFNILYAMGNSGPDNNTLSQQAEGKNIISVGAVPNHPYQDEISSFSSRGYADDGRIKPTVMNVGEGVISANRSYGGYQSLSGTSMATPGIAGQVGQIRQYYEEGWHTTGEATEADGFDPSNALVRATLVNGAEEISGNDAYLNDERFPNNDQGYGRTNLDRALHFKGDERKLKIFDSLKEGVDLDTGQSWNMEFEVDDPSQELEITLAWTDYPGSAGSDSSNPAIVNDLDLEIIAPDGTRYVGNAFTGNDPGYSEADPADNPWSGQRSAEYDGLNVEEDILLLPDHNGIQEGTYELNVKAHQVPEGKQPFAVVMNGGIKTNSTVQSPTVDIIRPQGGEEWYTEDDEEVRWDTTKGDGSITGVDLEYSLDNGSTWTDIVSGLKDTGSYLWNVPDEPSNEMRIRVTVHDENNQSGVDTSQRFGIIGELDQIAVTPGEESIVAGERLSYNVTGYDKVGNEVGDVTENTTWSIEGGAGGSWTDNEYASENAGEWNVTATYTCGGEDLLDEAILTVNTGAVDSVLIHTSSDQTVTAGETIDFDAEAYDQYGNLIEADDKNFTWQNTDNTGLFTETAAGEYGVNATYDGVSSPITVVTVEPAAVDYVEITPSADQVIEAGTTIDFDAEAFDRYDNLLKNEDTNFDWQNTDNTGLFTETTAGDHDVTATYDGVESNITTVTVETTKTDYVEISPPEDRTVSSGEELQFDAWAYDEYDNLITDNVEIFTWENASNGIFHEEDTGEYNVTAAYDGVTSSVTKVTVEATDVSYVLIFPGSDQVMTAGETIDFDAEAYDAHGNLVDEDDTNFTWNNTDTNGLFEATESGKYQVKAMYEGVDSKILDVTVEPAEVDSVEILPETEQKITAGETIDFDAEAYDRYNNLIQDDDTNFNWQNTDKTGSFSETTAGNYDVSATYDGVTSQMTVVTVQPASLDHIDIDPHEDMVVSAGESIDFSAKGFDGYGNQIMDEDENFSWEGTSASGLFNETDVGDHFVSASSDNVRSEEVTVVVEPGAPDLIEISEDKASIVAGDKTAYNITVYDRFGNLVGDVTEDAEWSIDEKAGGSWDGNVYTSDNPGVWNVTAKYEGMTAEAELEVEVSGYDLEIHIDGEGKVEPENLSREFLPGEEVELKAVPEDGWCFKEWTGDLDSEMKNITVTMEDHKDITAHFEKEKSPSFELKVVDLEDTLKEDEDFGIRFIIENTGEIQDTKEVALMVDGDKEQTWEVTLGPGEEKTYAFTWEPDEKGEHEVILDCGDDQQIETVYVDQSLSDNSSGDSLNIPPDYIYLFLPLVILSALILYYFKKRRM